MSFVEDFWVKKKTNKKCVKRLNNQLFNWQLLFPNHNVRVIVICFVRHYSSHCSSSTILLMIEGARLGLVAYVVALFVHRLRSIPFNRHHNYTGTLGKISLLFYFVIKF